LKELLADYIVKKVSDLIEEHKGKSSLVIGLGSGTTAGLAVKKLAARYSGKIVPFKAIATSYESASTALEAGIDVLPLFSGVVPDFSFDGADEVDPQLSLIKGGGAAMTQEKIVARRAGGITVIVTEEKLVPRLGVKFPVPVELLQIAVEDVKRVVEKLPGVSSMKLREGTGKLGPVTTELGNFILDVTYSGEIPADTESVLKLIPGVIETGLFPHDAKEVIVAKDNKLFRFLKGGALEPL